MAPTVIIDERQNTVSIIFGFPGIDRNGTSLMLEQDKLIGTMAVFDGWRVKVIPNTFNLIPKGSEEFHGMISFEIEQNAIRVIKEALYEHIDFTGKRTIVEAGQEDRPVLLPLAIDTTSAHITITEDRVVITCNMLD